MISEQDVMMLHVLMFNVLTLKIKKVASIFHYFVTFIVKSGLLLNYNLSI